MYQLIELKLIQAIFVAKIINLAIGEAISCDNLIPITVNSLNQTKVKLAENILTKLLIDANSNVTEFDFTCEPKLNVTNFIVVYFPYKDLTILDNRFRLDAIFNVSSGAQTWTTNVFSLARVKGIAIDKSQLYETMFFLSFRFSHLNIFTTLNGKRSEVLCDERTFENFTFFRPFFSISFAKVNFPLNGLCPLAFNGSKVREITFDDISCSFLSRNELKFTQMTTNVHGLFMAHFYAFYVRLNAQMLNEHLFKTVRELSFHHILTQIDNGVFQPFRRLKNIDFILDNYKQFFHTINMQTWMLDLNANVTVNESVNLSLDVFRLRFRFSPHTVSFNQVYEYPSEDLCLFRQFPHERLIVLMIESGEALKCTCTLVWLELYLSRYGSILNVTQATSFFDEDFEETNFHLFTATYVFKYCDEAKVNELKCDFETMFALCLLDNLTKVNFSTINF
jgi:hypothetical protein